MAEKKLGLFAKYIGVPIAEAIASRGISAVGANLTIKAEDDARVEDARNRLRRGSASTSEKVQISAAKNEFWGHPSLHILARSPHASVREAVVNNHSASSNILQLVWDTSCELDEDNELRTDTVPVFVALAKNTLTPDNVLTILGNGSNPDILNGLKNNASYQELIQRELEAIEELSDEMDIPDELSEAISELSRQTAEDHSDATLKSVQGIKSAVAGEIPPSPSELVEENPLLKEDISQDNSGIKR